VGLEKIGKFRLLNIRGTVGTKKARLRELRGAGNVLGIINRNEIVQKNEN